MIKLTVPPAANFSRPHFLSAFAERLWFETRFPAIFLPQAVRPCRKRRSNCTRLQEPRETAVKGGHSEPGRTPVGNLLFSCSLRMNEMIELNDTRPAEDRDGRGSLK
jgi:hypothetical protein